ncbi:MAG: N-acetylmuramoyl-L-alanine amidase [Bryobacteraceae bacterium]
MRRVLIPVLPVLAVVLTGLAPAAEVLHVSAVRYWSLMDVTRVVIEVSGDFEYHSERAHNPERVFFDILHSRPRIGRRGIYSSKVSDKLVKAIRVAETRPGVTRVVLDLETTGEYVANQLSNPDRLVIELRQPASSPQQIARATSPEPEPLPAPPVLRSSSFPQRAAAPELRTSVPAPPVPPPSTVHVEEPVRTAAARPAIVETVGRAAADGSSSLTRALGLKIRRVVIDPGHGGHDQGTVGPGGYTEKNLVLDVALRLGKLIEQRMGSEVIYTRSDDTFIPLQGRTAMANDKRADLFLSIHANSSPYPRIGGVETYYLNITNSKDALAVASRENATADQSVFELHDLIQKIALQDKAEESKEFAGQIQNSLYAFEARNNPGVKNRGVKKAPFVVLIGASMPSVLAEIGFLSNSREEALLKKPGHRQRLAEALYRGLYKYAQSLSHFQLAQANEHLPN